MQSMQQHILSDLYGGNDVMKESAIRKYGAKYFFPKENFKEKLKYCNDTFLSYLLEHRTPELKFKCLSHACHRKISNLEVMNCLNGELRKAIEGHHISSIVGCHENDSISSRSIEEVQDFDSIVSFEAPMEHEIDELLQNQNQGISDIDHHYHHDYSMNVNVNDNFHELNYTTNKKNDDEKIIDDMQKRYARRNSYRGYKNVIYNDNLINTLNVNNNNNNNTVNIKNNNDDLIKRTILREKRTDITDGIAVVERTMVTKKIKEFIEFKATCNTRPAKFFKVRLNRNNPPLWNTLIQTLIDKLKIDPSCSVVNTVFMYEYSNQGSSMKKEIHDTTDIKGYATVELFVTVNETLSFFSVGNLKLFKELLGTLVYERLQMKKLRNIVKHHSHFRPIRNDGNFYYRAITFAFLENSLRSNDFAKIKFLVKLLSDLKLHPHERRREKSHLNMLRIINAIQDLNELESFLQDKDDKTIDEALIYASRKLVSNFLQHHRGQITPDKRTIRKYISENYSMSVSEFCKYHVEKMDQEADVFILHMGILPGILETNCTIKIVPSDSTECNNIISVKSPIKFDKSIAISLMYLTGNQSIIYENDYFHMINSISLSMPKIQPIESNCFNKASNWVGSLYDEAEEVDADLVVEDEVIKKVQNSAACTYVPLNKKEEPSYSVNIFDAIGQFTKGIHDENKKETENINLDKTLIPNYLNIDDTDIPPPPPPPLPPLSLPSTSQEGKEAFPTSSPPQEIVVSDEETIISDMMTENENLDFHETSKFLARMEKVKSLMDSSLSILNTCSSTLSADKVNDLNLTTICSRIKKSAQQSIIKYGRKNSKIDRLLWILNEPLEDTEDEIGWLYEVCEYLEKFIESEKKQLR